MYAVSYSPSQAYILLLRHIAENDPVEELRADAGDMLNAYTEAGITQTRISVDTAVRLRPEGSRHAEVQRRSCRTG